ncbi:hypothetical protein [Methanopyrus kandleri]|uniref:Uncharacterized protein conserved in archaea n=1 Tax=Methanopyrus kandleri (strain AV19 / DSM 6324 / JCM 9639 / NBRC 100938) TaxID=190192 RepID=Q8TVZ4_METKA|nr:hypothetical protein [Methanopyrus kandleri]AAM02457.1 Uncharacterized protein conserved in archaea [Methanopyrus kandleri AV19]
MASRRYRYIGPCRCGLGPHAFYEDTETGEIKHAWQVLGEEGAPAPAWPGGWWRGGWRGGPGWGGGWWWLATADEETRKEVLKAIRETFGEDLAEAVEKLAESVSEGPEGGKTEELEELRKKLEELEKRLREMEEKE